MSEIGTELIQGDCIDVMITMESESVHAIITDPPYGLAFMGESWDEFEPKEYQEWCEKWSEEALRVLKPGGHMLSFSGSRTFHRLFVGVEDAGFEVRDTILWMYGSGFPKGQDMAKAIDKKLGKEDEREIVREKVGGDGIPIKDKLAHSGEEYDEESVDYDTVKRDPYVREAATEEAEQWDGWNTQLKPAFEPIVVARKPLAEDTITEQVMKTGTGAMNIGDCLVGPEVDTSQPGGKNNEDIYGEQQEGRMRGSKTGGRHPPNIALDEASSRMLDEQSSRFFYTSKARSSERTVGGRVDCPHPTVKPIDLMEWMTKLVSAEGQTVLDPFAGTGTTLMAAYNVGRNAIGIEKDEDYMETAESRVAANEAHTDEVGTEPDHVYSNARSW